METKELLEKLDELKSGMEGFTKTQIEAEVKKIQDSFSKIEAKADKSQIEAIQKSLDDIKSGLNNLTDWQVTKDEADKKNQEWIDQQVADKQKAKILLPEQPVTFKSAFAEALNEGDNYKNLEMLAQGHKERKKRFVIEMKVAGDMTTSNVTGTRYGSIFQPGIIEAPGRKVHVRTLVPNGPLGPGNTYTFLRESATDGTIGTVAEGQSKAQVDFDFTEPSVNVETIAGYVRFTKKVMNNLPGFVAFLNNRLPELLLRAEDAQLLTGDGSTPNISGIMDSGNYTSATSSATVLAEQLIDGLAQLEDDEDRNATGVLVRPVDYYGFFKNTASGSGEYDLPSNFVFVNGVLYVSGVPVFASTALTAGKYIVGDWQQGAQLLIQNAMRIEFFEQDADNVTKNKITARIEEDIAFPIYGDNYFIVGDVAGGS